MATGDPTFKEDLRKDGYSQEEKYFYELNRELIESKLREESHPHDQEEDELPDSPADRPKQPTRLIRILHKLFGVREGSQDLF